jgi:hypothetical protein
VRYVRLTLVLFALLILIPILVGLGGAVYECRMISANRPERGPDPPGAAEAQALAGSITYLRPEEQTFLTLPEWYVVFSADEYAAFLDGHRPSDFPYFEAAQQFWQGYYGVCRTTRERYPFNSGTHLMLAVVGASFTAENVVKGLYENTVGRLSEWTAGGEPVPEEAYARRIAAEYGAFIHTVPWYQFAFWSKIGPIWDPDLTGPHLARRIERRLALTLEYAVKAGYGWVIRGGTESTYAPEDEEILARVEGVTPEVTQREPSVRVLQTSPGGAMLVALPRYEKLTQLVPRLVAQGVRFSEIAGNDEIMVTVLAAREWRYDRREAATLILTLLIPSDPNRARFALRVPVSQLHTVVGDVTRASPAGSVTLEHIYDY